MRVGVLAALTGNFVSNFTNASSGGGGTTTTTDNITVSLNVTTTLPLTAASLTWTATGSASTTAGFQVGVGEIFWGDGDSSGGPSATHTYASGGPYTVVYAVTDNTGKEAQASQLISIPIIPQGDMNPSFATDYNTITAGHELSVIGAGYYANGQVAIAVNGTVVTTLTANVLSNGSGGFPLTQINYGSATGSVSVSATDLTTGIKRAVTVQINPVAAVVNPSISITNNYSAQTYQVVGTGFSPNSAVSIGTALSPTASNNQQYGVATLQTNSSGGFTYSSNGTNLNAIWKINGLGGDGFTFYLIATDGPTGKTAAATDQIQNGS